MRRALPLAIAILTSACTLIVEGVAPPACSTNSDCAILNELEGIQADACTLYQCGAQTNRCELGPRDADRDGLVAPECAAVAGALGVDCNDLFAGGEEVCNGVDDDCDGVIDERFTRDGESVTVLPAQPAEPLASVTVGASVEIADGAGAGELAVLFASGTNATLVIADGASGTAAPMSHQRAASLETLTNSDLEEGCHSIASDGRISGTSCGFADADVALTSDYTFVASVNTSGCGVGQLRVGYGDRATSSAAIIARGPARRSNAFTGVDVDPSVNICTGASRVSGVLGVARPSVAALDGAADQALVAVIADTVARPTCEAGEAPVEAAVEVLGLHVQTDTFGTEYGWVTASNEGIPQEIGATTGGGRPAVAAWEGTGYLVAFGNGSTIELVWVEPMARPPAFDGDGDVGDRTGLETEALTFRRLDPIAAEGPVDDVTIAFGSVLSGGIQLGLAWREGCGTGAETIAFRQLVLASDGAAIDETRSFPRVTIAETSQASAPSLAYAFDGLLAPEVPRTDGRPMGTRNNDGGWYLAWADASEMDPGPNDDRRVLTVRISEADGAPIDEPFALHAPSDQRRVAPIVYRTGDERIAYAFFAPDGEMSAMRGGLLSCAPPD